MSTSAYLRTRVDRSPSTAGLLVGDVLALGGFVFIGQQFGHRMRPLANPFGYLEAIVPFVLAWVAVAVLAGLYTADARSSLRRGVGLAVLAWLVALPVAHGLRVLVSGSTAPAFVVISAVVGGGFLLGWRVLAAFVLDSPA
jgi:hypothetical protein